MSPRLDSPSIHWAVPRNHALRRTKCETGAVPHLTTNARGTLEVCKWARLTKINSNPDSTG